MNKEIMKNENIIINVGKKYLVELEEEVVEGNRVGIKDIGVIVVTNLHI